MKITQERMNALLDQFTKATNQKEYKRIPYVDWKHLKTAGTCFADIVSDPLTGQISVVLTSKKGDIFATFKADDKSFGEFLLTKIMTEGEVKVMPPKENEIYSWIDTKCTYSYTPNGTITIADNNRSVSKNDYYSNYGTTICESPAYVTKDEFEDTIKTLTNKTIKENKTEMKGFNFDFGPVKTDSVKISVYGLAVKNTNGTYVSYDTTSGNLMDVDILNFDGSKFLYKMPVAIKDVTVGDIVIHNRVPMFVTSIGSDAKTLVVVDPVNGEKKEIMLTRSPFGFDFVTKIVNIIGNMSADANNPFGNMWMFALASGDGKDNSFANLAPLMLMSQGNTNIDPMMMYVLASGGKNDNLLPLMFMMHKNNAPAHTCNCGGNCGKTDVKS
jgi:hypothetical protein